MAAEEVPAEEGAAASGRLGALLPPFIDPGTMFITLALVPSMELLPVTEEMKGLPPVVEKKIEGG